MKQIVLKNTNIYKLVYCTIYNITIYNYFIKKLNFYNLIGRCIYCMPVSMMTSLPQLTTTQLINTLTEQFDVLLNKLNNDMTLDIDTNISYNIIYSNIYDLLNKIKNIELPNTYIPFENSNDEVHWLTSRIMCSFTTTQHLLLNNNDHITQQLLQEQLLLLQETFSASHVERSCEINDEKFIERHYHAYWIKLRCSIKIDTNTIYIYPGTTEQEENEIQWILQRIKSSKTSSEFDLLSPVEIQELIKRIQFSFYTINDKRIAQFENEKEILRQHEIDWIASRIKLLNVDALTTIFRIFHMATDKHTTITIEQPIREHFMHKQSANNININISPPEQKTHTPPNVIYHQVPTVYYQIQQPCAPSHFYSNYLPMPPQHIPPFTAPQHEPHPRHIPRQWYPYHPTSTYYMR